jgi:hypothetical protein
MPKKDNVGKRTHFTVGRSGKSGVFRDVHTGESVTRVMSERVFDKATSRAERKIREYAGAKRTS